jgi:hypothetical protein
MSERSWSGRTFTSLCSLVSFILLGLTGLILYIEPHGRVAYWTNWSYLGLEKDQWGNTHVISGLLFLVAGGFHLYYNWKPLINYLRSKFETRLRYKRELVVSSLILFWIVVSGIWSLPPLAYVSDLGETIKRSWVISPELEPPFGHAELVSLKTFCKKQRIPLDQAMAELRKAGFKVSNPGEALDMIAASKGTSGMEVYSVIKKLESEPVAMKSGTVWTPEKIEETFAGTGLGRKTFGQIIGDLALDAQTVRKRLNKVNIRVNDNDKIKDLADKHNTTPIKILTLILIEDS